MDKHVETIIKQNLKDILGRVGKQRVIELIKEMEEDDEVEEQEESEEDMEIQWPDSPMGMARIWRP